MSNDELPQEVVFAIQHILETKNVDKEDPLDDISNNFSPIDILNNFFPNEASLANTEAVKARISHSHQEFQQEINALHVQLKQAQDPSKMQLIQEMIAELLSQMSRIREKATESEAVVRNITKDIQVLDLAKKNLILSLTTLKRLQMLVNALTQLEEFVEQKKYAEMAQTLSAVKEISASFKSYLSVPRVAQVWKRINEIQGEIRAHVEADFDAFYLQDPSKPIKPSVIADACLVVDVLGIDVQHNLIQRYGALELKEYRRIFRPSDEAGQLDNISRRFAWFRRLLANHENEQGRVFPPEWRVGWHLLAKFIDITRDDMATLLSKAAPTLTVKALLEALQICSEFEASMVKKWAIPLREMLSVASIDAPEPVKSISSAFEQHMGVFIDAQDRAISDMLAPHRKGKSLPKQPRQSLDSSHTDDTGGDDSTPPTVLPSSTELFYFYGQSLDQCAKLSTGKPLYDLCNVHKKWLKIYAEDVLGGTNKSAPQAQALRKSTESRYDLNKLQNEAVMINTADYCHSTAIELEAKIREKIDDEYKDRITLQKECELFVGVISSSIGVLLREFELACEPAITSMTRTSWANLNQVTGQSPYTTELIQAVEQVMDAIKPLVEQKRYLRNLLDKISSTILAKFTNSLVKSRPLKEIGAEQLLIDLQAIRSFLVRLPGESLATASYARSLTKSTSRLETLLKVIVTPDDPPEGFILNYTLLIGDASFSNFQKILDLKGTPKAAQNNLLDLFVTITSTKELENTSFLTSLDMDPPTLGQLGTLASPLPIGGEITPGVFAGLSSPPLSGLGMGQNPAENNRAGEQRQVFSDFKRFVSFGLRRESLAPS